MTDISFTAGSHSSFAHWKPWLVLKLDGSVDVNWTEAERQAAAGESYAKALIAVRDGRYHTIEAN